MTTDQRARDWHSVQANLLEAVKHADTWAEIVRAADALFHARLIFDQTFKPENPSVTAMKVER